MIVMFGRVGMTLVEVMLAVVLLSIVVLGAGAYVERAYAQLKWGETQAGAYDCAEAFMELFKATDASKNLPVEVLTGPNVASNLVFNKADNSWKVITTGEDPFWKISPTNSVNQEFKLWFDEVSVVRTNGIECYLIVDLAVEPVSGGRTIHVRSIKEVR